MTLGGFGYQGSSFGEYYPFMTTFQGLVDDSCCGETIYYWFFLYTTCTYNGSECLKTMKAATNFSRWIDLDNATVIINEIQVVRVMNWIMETRHVIITIQWIPFNCFIKWRKCQMRVEGNDFRVRNEISWRSRLPQQELMHGEDHTNASLGGDIEPWNVVAFGIWYASNLKV